MKRSGGLYLHAMFVALLLYAPIAVIVTFSFNSAAHEPVWQGFTLGWYRTLFHSPEKLSAAVNTLILAGASTALSTVLGTMLGVALSRYEFPGKRLCSWLIYIPVIVPDIVAAIALLIGFSLLRNVLSVFELSLRTMVIAHVTFQVPFVAIIVRSRLAGLDPALEEAAHDLGATAWQKYRYVLLPLILPGVLAGAALAFTLSIDDFVISFFTSGAGSTTLPILIYSSVKRGITPDINALSALLILASAAGTVFVTLLRRPR